MNAGPIGHGWPARRERLVSATVALARQRAGRGEAAMKGAARWTDRTGNARQGLRGGVEIGLGSTGSAFTTMRVMSTGGSTFSTRLRRIILFFAHSLGYGKWLETHKGPAYGHRKSMSPEQLEKPEVAGTLAVIHPTVKRLGPGYVAAVKRIWRRSSGTSGVPL